MEITVECFAWTSNGMMKADSSVGAYVTTRTLEQECEAAHRRGFEQGKTTGRDEEREFQRRTAPGI